jgi:hypothetical protein
MKLDGVLKGNIAINEGTAGIPLEINSAATTDVALVTGGGNVGIGTNAPTTKLDVNGTAKATAFTTSGNITTTGGGSITSATNVTAAGFISTGTSAILLGSAGSTGGNLVFATTGGTQSLIAGTGATGSQTLPSTAGTLLNNASAIDVSKITTGTTLPSNIVTSSLTAVGTITSGTWNATAIDISKGGTGNQYGSPLVGKAALSSTYTKASNDTTPEAVFRNAAGTIQYLNVDADASYIIEGLLHFRQQASGTAAAPRLSVQYFSTGTTTALAAQLCNFTYSSHFATSTYISTTTVVAENTNLDLPFTSTAAVTHNIIFRAFIRTHASTAGRINIGATQTVAGSSLAPTFNAGSYLSVYRMTGSGLVQTFGNWA